MNDALVVALLVSTGWILSLCFHEFGHAITAYVGGDNSVKERGYLTLNPLAYTNLGLSIVLPTIFLFLGGIGLPGAAVLVETNRLRHRFWASLVSAAGPFFSTLCVIALVILIHSGALNNHLVLLVAAAWLLQIEILVTILNLLPIPGLDGFGIIEPFLSADIRARVRRANNLGFLILFGVLWFVPGANALLWGSADLVMELLGVSEQLADAGAKLYRQGSPPIAVGILAIAAIYYYFFRKRLNWYHHAEDLFNKKKFAECNAFVDTVLAKNEDPRALRLKAHCELNLATASADESSRLRHKEQAISAIDKSIALKSDDAESWYVKGLISNVFDDLDGAVGAYRRALDIDPATTNGFTNVASIFLLLRRNEELLELSEKRLQAVPQDPVARFMKGIALGALGKSQEGLDAVNEANSLGLSTGFTSMYKAILQNRLGDERGTLESIKAALADKSFDVGNFVQGLLAEKEFQDALGLTQRMLSMKPDDAGVMQLQSAALFRLGRYEESIALSDKCIEKKHLPGHNWYNKACSLMHLGRADEALEAMKKALELTPSLAQEASGDNDLGALRDDPRFEELIRTVTSNAAGTRQP